MAAAIKDGPETHEPLTPENFREVIRSVAFNELKKHRHAWQYLEHHYSDQSKLDEFNFQLMTAFPALPQSYATSWKSAPAHPDSLRCISTTCLGMSRVHQSHRHSGLKVSCCWMSSSPMAVSHKLIHFRFGRHRTRGAP